MTYSLRWYQREALNAVKANAFNNVLVCLPCGAGKSIIIAELIKWAMQWTDTRICNLAPRKELIKQNMEKILSLYPNAPVDIWCSGLNRKRAAPVTVASIQSIWKKSKQVSAYDIIIVDEAHGIPHENDGMYRSFFKDQKKLNPNLKIWGLSATPWRMKTGLLHKGKNALFEQLVYEAKIIPLISEGYLCPVVSRHSKNTIDTKKLHVRGGDFIPKEMEEMYTDEQKVEGITKEILTLAQLRKKILVFTSGIKHAVNVVQEFYS